MRSKISIAIALFGALCLGVVAPGSGALHARDEVPFKGDAVSQYVGSDMSTLTSYFEIVSGNCTHLGKVSGEAEVHWKLVSLVPLALEPIGAEITLVAANGDELYISHDAAEWDPDAGASVSDYEITGGTGRFAGASGSGAATASGQGEVTNTWKGTIDYKKK